VAFDSSWAFGEATIGNCSLAGRVGIAELPGISFGTTLRKGVWTIKLLKLPRLLYVSLVSSYYRA